MGLLVDGIWRDQHPDRSKTGGRFIRPDTQFRDRIEAGGRFAPEAGRYHLYISLACPWAHRTQIFRALKGLAPLIGLSVVDPITSAQGWAFSDGPDCIPDTVGGAAYLHELYIRAEPAYSGRVTVPVLWDKAENTIVNNESAEIIRLFNSAFDTLTGNDQDFYPQALRDEIDAINEEIYTAVNNGVYRCGFATSQEAYEEAFTALFACLDRLEERLSGQRYLCGARQTEADWRLFTTLLRFDPVYVGHFKCNLKRLADYPNLSNYLRDLFQTPGIAETCNMAHIKSHYYQSHTSINPNQIVPKGPEIDNAAAHDRARF